MTLLRFLAIVYCFLLLLPAASGQSTLNPAGRSQASNEQAIVLDSAIMDSISLEVPNVFTPNGDGANDFIEVATNGSTVYDFNIFTRTGTQIYHSNSPRIFWDGTNSAGLDLKEGVYYYVIEEEGDSSPYSITGFIYLFR